MKIAAYNDTHDSSVCVIDNGKINFFCKEERLCREKRAKDPITALKLLEEIDNKIDLFLYCTPSNIYNETHFYLKKEIELRFNTKAINYSFLNHHLCHASLAFYNSKFEECLVFVIDRNGSLFYMNGTPVCREAESVFIAKNISDIVPLYKNYWVAEQYLNMKSQIKEELKEALFPNDQFVDVRADSFLSIVKVYEAATTLIGQHALENGKTMGLSAYGKNESYQYFSNLYPVEPLFSSYAYPLLSSFNFESDQIYFANYLKHVTKKVSQQNFQMYADRAYEVQMQTQQQVLALIKKYVKKTGIKQVCIVGGYGLNVVANGFYIENMPNVEFYFEPIADDTGIPIGACMYEYAKKTNKKPEAIDNVFFHYFDYSEKLTQGKYISVSDIADLLAKGMSIAIFDGNPESGPRALGHRSILFDPRIKDGKDIVNRIKNREWYRPFAGVILESEFCNFFNTMGLSKSPNMTINFFAKEGIKNKIPSIIHTDNSCRIQTVSEGFLYELLIEFKNKTNCPVLLNTSFNLAGEPLVQTKKQAIEMLNASSLDAVYFVQDQKIVFN